MKLKERIERIERIDRLIRMYATGSPKELAKKLDISERCLYKYLDLMKFDLNAPIKYNEYRKTYEYYEEGTLTLNIGWKSKK